MNVLLTDRFWSKVQEGPEGCWLWTAYKSTPGYGRFLYDRKVRFAHRLSYEALRTDIPAELELDHLCRVRHCVNPWHLEPVTRRVNVLRSPISVTAINSRKTHCSQGHELTPSNCYINPRLGGRVCRACQLHHSRIRQGYKGIRAVAVAS